MLKTIRYGSGPVVWLAFHGIGQEPACFAPFGERLAQTHTIYSLALPFHGESRHDEWPVLLTADYWQSLVAEFLCANQITRFSLVGFSLGGRFALVTAQAFADRLDQLILLAPDGVTQDPWFRLATATLPGRWLLRFALGHPAFLERLGQTLVRVGLLNVSLLRFAQATMRTPGQRTQLYSSWTGFRRLTVSIPELARALTIHQVRVRLYLGQFDAVLPRKHTMPLEKLLPLCEVIILPTGHTSLVRRVSEQPTLAGFV